MTDVALVPPAARAAHVGHVAHGCIAAAGRGGVRFPLAKAQGAIAVALDGAMAQLRSPARWQAPVLLAAAELCVDLASAFVADVARDPRRVRPSASLDLELSRLIGAFARESRWRGPCFVLVTPGEAVAQALRWASVSVASGRHEAVLVCEVARDAGTLRADAIPLAADVALANVDRAFAPGCAAHAQTGSLTQLVGSPGSAAVIAVGGRGRGRAVEREMRM